MPCGVRRWTCPICSHTDVVREKTWHWPHGTINHLISGHMVGVTDKGGRESDVCVHVRIGGHWVDTGDKACCPCHLSRCLPSPPPLHTHTAIDLGQVGLHIGTRSHVSCQYRTSGPLRVISVWITISKRHLGAVPYNIHGHGNIATVAVLYVVLSCDLTCCIWLTSSCAIDRPKCTSTVCLYTVGYI